MVDIVTPDVETWIKMHKCPCKGYQVDEYLKTCNFANTRYNNAFSQGNINDQCKPLKQSSQFQ